MEHLLNQLASLPINTRYKAKFILSIRTEKGASYCMEATYKCMCIEIIGESISVNVYNDIDTMINEYLSLVKDQKITSIYVKIRNLNESIVTEWEDFAKLNGYEFDYYIKE